MSDDSTHYTSQYRIGYYFSILAVVLQLILIIMKQFNLRSGIFLDFSDNSAFIVLYLAAMMGFILGIFLLTRDISPVFSQAGLLAGIISIIISNLPVNQFLTSLMFVIFCLFNGVILFANFALSRKKVIGTLFIAVGLLHGFLSGTLIEYVLLFALFCFSAYDLYHEPEITLEMLNEVNNLDHNYQ